jgi:hypothetical protein
MALFEKDHLAAMCSFARSKAAYVDTRPNRRSRGGLPIPDVFVEPHAERS